MTIKDEYPIVYKCRMCKKEFDYLDKILYHIQYVHKITL